MKILGVPLFPNRFTKIDDLTRSDHYFLEEDDECFFMGEYTARAGFGHSDTNQLIYNIKAPMRCKGTNRWPHKEEAIANAASAMRRVLEIHLDKLTIIPVPPSKTNGDSDYDDRMLRIVQNMCSGLDGDIREIVTQCENLLASHEAVDAGNDRSSIDELITCYELDDSLCYTPREIIGVFDDVITTGRHFRAMKTVLRARFPTVRIVGFFIARVVPNSLVDFDNLE